MILFYRFHDMKGPFTEMLLSHITAQFHGGITRYLRKENGLACCHEFIEEWTDIHLVRKRIISHNDIPHPVTYQSFPEAGDNGKRQFLQLLWGELSLDLTHLLS